MLTTITNFLSSPTGLIIYTGAAGLLIFGLAIYLNSSGS